MRFSLPINTLHCFQALLIGLLLTVGGSAKALGQEVIFFETFGPGSTVGPVAVSAYTDWDNVSPVNFTGNTDVRLTFSSGESGITGASGGANIHFAYNETRTLTISGINTANYKEIQLELLQYKHMLDLSNELKVHVSEDGNHWAELTYTRETGTGTQRWEIINPTGTIPSVENLHIRFSKAPTEGSNAYFRIDDVKLTGQFISEPPYIVSIAAVSDIELAYGTNYNVAVSQLSPTTTIFDSEGNPHTVNLSWTILDYDGESSGEYVAVGTFDLPDGLVQSEPPMDLEVTATVTVQDAPAEPPHIVSIASVSDVTVPYGTSLNDALGALVSSTSIADSEGNQHTVDLIWFIPGYNAEVAGNYQATGTFVLPGGVVQGDPPIDLEVTATLTVTPEPPSEPQPVEVTFTVDMSKANGFTPLQDQVLFTGCMFDYAIPGENPKQFLEQTSDPMVFSQTLDLLPGRYYYKFYLNEGLSGAEWPSSPIRIADVSSDPDEKNVFHSIFGEHELTVSTGPELSSPALVYPNPARTTLHIASDDGQPIFEVILLNLQGLEVYQAQNVNSSRHQIHVGNLKTGLYLLRVLNPRGWYVVRVQVTDQ